jgi:hypothetical protein
MLIEKLLQTRVQLTDPADLYSGNINAIIMDNLKQRYENKCFKSCLVIEVLEIIEKSHFIFSRHSQNAAASCCVRFKVLGMVAKKYEKLHNCVVSKIQKNGDILCKNKYAAIYIKASSALQTIREGQTIVVLAGIMKYIISKPRISVNSYPFIPVFRSNVIYNITIEPSTLIPTFMSRLLLEEKKNGDIKDDIKNHFVSLLYPYRTKNILNSMLGQGCSFSTFSDVVGMPNGTSLMMSRPDCLPCDAPVVMIHSKPPLEDLLGYDELKKSKDGIVTTENYTTIMVQLISSYIELLIDIRELSSTYNTMEKIEENKNLWNIYEKHKRD